MKEDMATNFRSNSTKHTQCCEMYTSLTRFSKDDYRMRFKKQHKHKPIKIYNKAVELVLKKIYMRNVNPLQLARGVD